MSNDYDGHAAQVRETGASQQKAMKMRNTSARHWTLLVALLASPVVASAQKTTDDQEPVASPPSPTITTSDQAERIERVETRLGPPLFAAGQSTEWTLAERMVHHRVPGVSIAVINEGKIEWARGYGVMEAGGSTPVTPDTMFQAASISKPVTAIAVLRLVEAGELQLDQDVNLALKSWEVPGDPALANESVTIRRILSHTAGLTVHGFSGYAEGEPVPSLLQILNGEEPANSGAIRVDTVPGTQERYSGGGYVVATQLLRDVTEQSFADLLQTSVFDPLEMTRSTFEQPLPAVFAPTAARAHRGDGTAIAGNWHTYPELAPDGLWTTPSDLARFAIELQQSLQGQSNKVLTADMTRQMLTNQLGSMGLGIIVHGEGAAQRFGHDGANAGFRCNMVAYANSGRGAVIMTNSDNGSQLIHEIQRSIAAEYDWPDFQPRKVTAVDVDAQVLAGYVGRYKVSTGGSIMTIQAHEGLLTAELYQQEMNLIAESEARFRVPDDESAVTFFTAATGRKGLWARQHIWGKLPETTGVDGSEGPADGSDLEARSAGDSLVFRNTPSWGRSTDFVDVLGESSTPISLAQWSGRLIGAFIACIPNPQSLEATLLFARA